MIRISPGVASVHGRDGIVVLALGGTTCVPLEVSAGGEAIWRLLQDAPLSVCDIADTIAADAGLGRADVLPAISSFVETLVEHGLVVPVAGTEHQQSG